MQGLTNTIRRAPPDVMAHGEQYERALSAQIIMLAPFAPHFSSELWSRFIAAPNRVNDKSEYICWSEDVFGQKWPRVEAHHKVKFLVKINNSLMQEFKIPCGELNILSEQEAILLALKHDRTERALKKSKIMSAEWIIHKDYGGTLNFTTENIRKHENSNENVESKKSLEQ